VLLITGARLGHLHGYRRMFLLGVGSFTLASLACGLAPDPGTLVVARFVQGAGAALLVPQVLSGIQLNFAGDARTRALGLFVLALSGSAVLGQILGGALISADLFGTGWRPAFLINVPIGLALVPAARRWLPADPGGRAARLDLAGVAVLTLALLLVLVPLTLGREAGWPAWTWACLAASLPSMGFFAWVERGVADRGGAPLLDLRVLARPEVGWALGSRAAAAGTYFALLFVIAVYLQQGLGNSPLDSGLALVSWVAAFGLGGPLLRRLPEPLGRRAAVIGSLLMAAAYTGIALGVGSGHATGAWLTTLLGVGGFGFGLATTALLAHLTAAVPGGAAADISGLYNTSSQLAAVAGIACFGSVYLVVGDQGGRLNAMTGFASVSMVFAVTALVAAVSAHQASTVTARRGAAGVLDGPPRGRAHNHAQGSPAAPILRRTLLEVIRAMASGRGRDRLQPGQARR
jgi:MFS family permease